MSRLINGSPSRRAIGVLATALAMACTGPALAQTSSDSGPAAQNPGQAMGAMKQQMMQQMQQCMDQIAPMNGTDQNAMRQQMMERMHSCMEGMMAAGGAHHGSAEKEGSGPNQGEEHKPEAHDQSGKGAEQPGKDAEPDH